MWFKTTLRTEIPARPAERLFDEAFLRRLERLSLQPQRFLRGQPALGEHLSRRQLPATIFSDHRPYSAGDDYRYIDWNAYAHQEQIFVKLGEIEQNVPIHVLVDVSRSMQWGEWADGQPSKLRTALRLAAALGYLTLSHNDQLIVQPFGDTTLRRFGPARGKARLAELLRFLESLRSDQPTAIAQVLASHAAHYQRGGLLVLCSDLLTAEGLAEGLRMLPPPRWQVLVLHMIDPHELDPPAGETAELVDAETGKRLQVTLDDQTLAVFRRNVASWQAEIRDACGRHGAMYAQLPTTWPFERHVIPYLHARRILR
ncbi:MAG: DUF58 domain-containing protein [Roseiflexaceae bacterium]|nr:DUF58 domain-containing protein [Roseiflexaceae bacterium]